ncbi:reverse transcriptase [Tanacetum coccineum]
MIYSSSSSNPTGEFWKQIWRLNVIPKIRLFLWKACSNALATRDRWITCGYPWPDLEEKRFGMIQERYGSLVSEPLVIENILAMFSPTRKKSRWGTVFPTGLKRYKKPLMEPKEIG